jgi:DNA-binding NtrC family response regulator
MEQRDDDRGMLASRREPMRCNQDHHEDPDHSALVGRTVADVERELILETLKHCLGNRTHAANILGILIRTLRNKLNEHADDGMQIPPPANGGGDSRLAG